MMFRMKFKSEKVANGALALMPQEAVIVLREAVRLSPQSALAYATLGQAFRLLGKFQEALVALQEALRLSPEDPVAHNYLGMTYESLQRKQEALAAYKEAIDFKSDYAEAHYNLALLYHTLGDRGQAQHHYNILRTITPDLADDLLKKMGQ
ncbi:MAG: tetratricopeptide repeat protein [Pyrinomonadaceae bacterium]